MKSRVIASLLAVVLLVGALAGCGSKITTIATLGTEEIPIGYYSSQMILMRVQLENYYGDEYDAYMSQTNASDPTRTNAQVYNDSYKKAFETLYMFKLKVAEFGLTMDEYRNQTFDKEYEYFKSMFRSMGDYNLFLTKCGLTEEEHREIYMESVYYQDLIYAHFFDPEVGTEKYTEDDVRTFYDGLVDYAIKHILFVAQTTDEDGNALPDSETEANFEAAKTKAEETLAKINSGSLDFDDAMNELSGDSDLADYPHGYGFVENEEGFPACFTEAAKALNEGEYGIYRSEYGYHIIQKLNLDDFFKADFSTYEKAMTTDILSKKYDQWLSELHFEYKDDALKVYDFASTSRTNVNLNPNVFNSGE